MSRLTNNPQRWTSRGRQISKSLYHRDTYVIDNNDGTFHFINTSEEVALKMWPEDKKKGEVNPMVNSTRKFGVIIHDESLPASTKKSIFDVEE